MPDNTSVGEIVLDLVVNRNGFDRSVNSIIGLAKKAGAAIAAAFAVDKLVAFGKSCIELGSDLAEVQNVVDVTFPNMAKQIDKFAKSAAGSFGLSETMAKKFTGTFGSMAEAFGFSEKESYKMAAALTGLSGDVASFYNISQDEAYTKLKSVFSGETETLKDLGIVMTQSALDAYALANGYGKAAAKMTEAEKVSLRLAFVQDQLKNATGDFARTSDSWANQTRILSLQFDSLKASIGQGLINVFTPVIKWINMLLLKITVAADKFKEFTELIIGNKGSGNSSGASGAAAETADNMDNAADSAKNTADSTSKTAKNLKKASRFLAGFDKITKMDSKDTDSAGNDADSDNIGNSINEGTGIKIKADTSDLDKADKKLEKIKTAFTELKSCFVRGFRIGLGDTSVLDSIRDNMKSIRQSIWDIVSDKEVQASLENMFFSLSESAGKTAGSFASIGLTIVDNLTGGVSKYLEQNTDRIKKYLINMFDITAETESIRADFWVAIADIFTVFRSDDAKQITADCIKIFADAGMGISEVLAKLERDVLRLVTQPIVENSEKIKTVLSNTLKPVKKVVHTIAKSVEETFDRMNMVYDEKISPAFQDITDGITDIVGTICDNYNQHIAPVLNTLASEFDKLWKSCIQPTINKAVDLFGDISECCATFFEMIKPYIEYLINTAAPVLAENLQNIGRAVMKVFGNISKLAGNIVDIFSGLLEFLTGVFKGDWSKAWNGVKKIFKGFKDYIGNMVKTIVSIFKLKFEMVKNVVLTPFRIIGKQASDIWKGIKKKIVEIVTGLTTKVSEKVKGLKKGFVDTFMNIKKKVTSIFDKLWNKGIKGTINAILSGVEKMVNGVIKAFNGMINSINNLGFKLPGWLPKKWANKELKFNINTLPEVNIPALATGGYVKANTPQLAMIGDNRHQGGSGSTRRETL